MAKRYAIIRHCRGASVQFESGPHTHLVANLRIRNRPRLHIAPWEGSEADTTEAYVARATMRWNPGAHFPEAWKRWREPVLYTDSIESVRIGSAQ